MSLMPAGPSGPLREGDYGFQRSLSLTGVFTCFIVWGMGAHEWEGQMSIAQIAAGLLVTLHS